MRILVVLSLFLGLSAQARTDINPEGNKVTHKGAVSLWSDWVKDKGKKYDLSFTIQNEHDQPIIILLREMRCFRGAMEGQLKHTFFNTGEKTINFRPSELKNFTLVCNLGGKAKGPYKVKITNVYENPSGDAKTIGKSIAKNVEWQVTIAGED